jgi:hypothetical protein
MAVAADQGDPASPWHPIHPPWKREVGRRTAVSALNVVYGNTSAPVTGPIVTSVFVDPWDRSWGDYHYGFGAGNNVCGAGSGFLCMGLRIGFDQPVSIKQTFGVEHGYPNGFWLESGAMFQPALLVGTGPQGNMIQLNVTWGAATPPQVLKYAWEDYPTMLVYSTTFDLPAVPFNISLPHTMFAAN